jgi:hypothetical protein
LNEVGYKGFFLGEKGQDGRLRQGIPTERESPIPLTTSLKVICFVKKR